MFERVKRKKFISETDRTWTGDLHIYGPTCYQLIHLDSWHVWMLYNFKIYIQLKNWRGKILEFINYIQATNWAFLNYMQTIKFNCIYSYRLTEKKPWFKLYLTRTYLCFVSVNRQAVCHQTQNCRITSTHSGLPHGKLSKIFLHRSPFDISLILKH